MSPSRECLARTSRGRPSDYHFGQGRRLEEPPASITRHDSLRSRNLSAHGPPFAVSNTVMRGPTIGSDSNSPGQAAGQVLVSRSRDQPQAPRRFSTHSPPTTISSLPLSAQPERGKADSGQRQDSSHDAVQSPQGPACRTAAECESPRCRTHIRPGRWMLTPLHHCGPFEDRPVVSGPR